MDKIWKWSLIIVGVILLDQITKGVVQANFMENESVPVIDGFFNFTYVKNPGAAFGMGAGANNYIRWGFFRVLPVIACFWLIYLIWSVRKEYFMLGLAYSLIFAGAIGNLIDRFAHDFVVDFLDFYWGTSHFPAFNVADSAITIAAILLIIDYIIQFKKQASEKEQKEKPTAE